jgi:integrase
MPLTDTKVLKAKPAEKAFKLFDGQGLFMIVTPTGGKWWRLKYRRDEKEQTLSVGTYPNITLAQARDKAKGLRSSVANGVDPSAQRTAEKLLRREQIANSFEAIAREWLIAYGKRTTAEYTQRIARRMENDIFPAIGRRPISDIKAADVLKAVKKIEARGARETAHRALAECGRIFRYAVATQRVERDVCADLRGALEPVEVKHFAAITEPIAVGELLRALYGYTGTPTVVAALKLAPLTFVRPGELRRMEWAHLDLDTAEWRYLVTKTKTDHIVPLATQAVAILRELEPLTGHGRYVFPGARDHERPMSDNAVLAALRRMNIGKDEMSGHGFRATARTLLDEEGNERFELIEHQLAHAVKDANGRAYNRTQHLVERKRMMQKWADYLDGLRNGAEVIAFKARAVA